MDRFIQFSYNGQPFPSIDGNKNDENLSLETALQPALSLVNQLDDHIKRAKQLRHHPSDHDLNEDQSAAVFLYADKYDSQGLPDVLNEALQSGDQTMIEPWLDFLKLLKSALNKLPTVNRTIWRGLPIDIFEKLKENDEFVCWGINSCSMSADIIKQILPADSIICSIEPLNGKDIRGYTLHESDEEVLLLPGTRLRVKSKGLNNEMNGSVICLEEISEIPEEPIVSTDVTMASPQNSVNEVDAGEYLTNNDHGMTTPTTVLDNNQFLPSADLMDDPITAVITFVNGDRYELTYQAGKKQGYGKYYSVNKIEFEDQPADEKATGEGICTFQNGDCFIGTYKHGARDGHGIFYKKDGSIEIGTWTDDKLIDQVLRKCSSGDKYEWKDRDNLEHWYGAYYDDDGNRYIGNVNNDQAQGLGVRFWSDGSRYEGNFKDDKKHGFGKYYYTDRGVYTGQWKNDKINGNGELQWRSGTKYEGQFINGKINGQGRLSANGKIKEGQWKNDEYIGSV